MKYQLLKKQLIVQTAILAALLAVMGGAVWYFNSIVDDYQGKSHLLEHELDAIETQTKALREKYIKAQTQLALYNKVINETRENGLAIGREVAMDKFAQFKSQYYLNELHLNMDAPQPVPGAVYTRGKSAIISSPVKTDFTTLSDEYVYTLIKTMTNDLPGSVKITELDLIRQADITDDILRSISQKGSSSLVKGTLNFTWYGIKLADTNDSNADTQKNH